MSTDSSSTINLEVSVEMNANETDVKQVAVGVDLSPKHPIMKTIQTDEK